MQRGTADKEGMLPPVCTAVSSEGSRPQRLYSPAVVYEMPPSQTPLAPHPTPTSDDASAVSAVNAASSASSATPAASIERAQPGGLRPQDVFPYRVMLSSASSTGKSRPPESRPTDGGKRLADSNVASPENMSVLRSAPSSAPPNASRRQLQAGAQRSTSAQPPQAGASTRTLPSLSAKEVHGQEPGQKASARPPPAVPARLVHIPVAPANTELLRFPPYLTREQIAEADPSSLADAVRDRKREEKRAQQSTATLRYKWDHQLGVKVEPSALLGEWNVRYTRLRMRVTTENDPGDGRPYLERRERKRTGIFDLWCSVCGKTLNSQAAAYDHIAVCWTRELALQKRELENREKLDHARKAKR